jgi:hypothetical protein
MALDIEKKKQYQKEYYLNNKEKHKTIPKRIPFK